VSATEGRLQRVRMFRLNCVRQASGVLFSSSSARRIKAEGKVHRERTSRQRGESIASTHKGRGGVHRERTSGGPSWIAVFYYIVYLRISTGLSFPNISMFSYSPYTQGLQFVYAIDVSSLPF